MKPKIIVILGPTGVGKSKMGIEIAKKYNGEIISADSVQVFYNFNIGSAKIKPEEMQGVKHHLIDVVLPSQEFSAFDYVSNAKILIDKIISKNKLPIFVGGTALYIKSLIENYNFGGVEKNNEVRNLLQKELEEKGLDYLFEKLEYLSPEIAKTIDKNNSQRVVRALEIALSNNKKSKAESEYDCLIFALNKDRSELYSQINKRVDLMIEEGLIDEVKFLLTKYGENVQPFKAIGYKEVLPYLKNEYSKEKMIELIKQHSRNYAKRQITFIKSINDVKWIDCDVFTDAKNEIEMEIEKWLKN